MNITIVAVAVVAALSWVAGCTEPDPLYCGPNQPCGPGYYCDYPANTCRPIEAGIPDLGADLKIDIGSDGTNDAAHEDKGSSSDGPTLDGPGADATKSNGAFCNSALECLSNHCTDGVCCDSECAGTCRSCALSNSQGSCTLIPDGMDPDKECGGAVPACGGVCDGKGACAYAPAIKSCGAPTCSGGQLTTKQCDGNGGCSSSTTNCGGYACNTAGDGCLTSCTSDAQCTGTFQCIGNKCVANLPNGSACGNNNKACASGFCVDGVCCNTKCNAGCQACNLPGKTGTCSPEPDGTSCGPTSCTGFTQTTLECKSGACAPKPTTCPGHYKCDGAGQNCLTSCTSSSDCNQSVTYCAGTSCVALKVDGSACKSAQECVSGNCVDGVCCQSACTGPCKSCKVAGKVGTCSNIPNGQDPDQECKGVDPACSGSCNGTGACTYPGATVACAASSCSGSTLTTYGCNGAGKCIGSNTSCGNFICSAGACLTSCTADNQCVGGKFCTMSKCLSWVQVSSGTTEALDSVWGTSASNVWAVGAKGTILHFNGSTWTSTNSPTTEMLRSVWGSSTSSVWAVGDGGTIIHFDGSSWKSQSPGTTTAVFYGVWGTGATNVWAVGLGGTIYHRNGSGWSAFSSGTTSTLRYVWGLGANDIWAAGHDGKILRYSGSGWSPEASGVQTWLTSIWGSSTTDVWIVSHGTSTLHRNASGWSVYPGPSIGYAWGLWGKSATDIWAVGWGGVAAHFDGQGWTTHSTGVSSENLGAVWGTGTGDLWAVGTGGTIVRAQ